MLWTLIFAVKVPIDTPYSFKRWAAIPLHKCIRTVYSARPLVINI